MYNGIDTNGGGRPEPAVGVDPGIPVHIGKGRAISQKTSAHSVFVGLKLCVKKISSAALKRPWPRPRVIQTFGVSRSWSAALVPSVPSALVKLVVDPFQIVAASAVKQSAWPELP
jgi:hypothetical protein